MNNIRISRQELQCIRDYTWIGGNNFGCIERTFIRDDGYPYYLQIKLVKNDLKPGYIWRVRYVCEFSSCVGFYEDVFPMMVWLHELFGVVHVP
jgi:hypothetical protein